MSAPASITEEFDTLYSTTWQLMREQAADNIFESTPFWFYMQEGDRIRREVGGRWIGIQVEYADHDDAIDWIGRDHSTEVADINTEADKEFLSTAKYDWKYLAGAIFRSYVDDSQNRGRASMMKIVDKKLNNVEKSLAAELEKRLFGSANGDQMLGLKDIVPEDPSGDKSELAEIDQSWWRNEAKDLEDDNPAVHLLPNMRTMFHDVSVGNDTPNVITTSQRVFELYEDEVLEYKQIVNRREGDASFDTILFKGKPMIWSDSCDDDKAYFLNTDYLELVADEDIFFEMTDWKDAKGDLDRIAQIITMLNLVTSNRRMQGVIFNIGEESA